MRQCRVVCVGHFLESVCPSSLSKGVHRALWWVRCPKAGCGSVHSWQRIASVCFEACTPPVSGLGGDLLTRRSTL